jgi:hypothetical protein
MEDLEWYKDRANKRIDDYENRLKNPQKPGDPKNMQKAIDFQKRRIQNINRELNRRCTPPVPPRVPWWLRWGPPIWLYPPLEQDEYGRYTA